MRHSPTRHQCDVSSMPQRRQWTHLGTSRHFHWGLGPTFHVGIGLDFIRVPQTVHHIRVISHAPGFGPTSIGCIKHLTFHTFPMGGAGPTWILRWLDAGLNVERVHKRFHIEVNYLGIIFSNIYIYCVWNGEIKALQYWLYVSITSMERFAFLRLNTTLNTTLHLNTPNFKIYGPLTFQYHIDPFSWTVI